MKNTKKVVRLLLTIMLFAFTTNVFAERVHEGDTTITGSFSATAINSPLIIRGNLYMSEDASMHLYAGAGVIVVGDVYASNKITIDANGKLIVGGDFIVEDGFELKGTDFITKSCYLYVVGDMDTESFKANKYMKLGGETELIAKFPNLMDKLNENAFSEEEKLETVLASFDGEAFEYSNKLNWSTSSESNVDYFTIWESEDGINWSWVAEEFSVNGTTTSVTDYEYVHNKGFNDTKTYYKLTQTNLDGVTSTLDTVLVGFFTSIEDVKDSFFNSSEKQTIIVTSTDGKTLLKKDFDGTEESYKEVIKSLHKGVYILTLQSASKTVSKKIAK